MSASDSQKILELLNSIQTNVSDLMHGQGMIQAEQEEIRRELQTVKGELKTMKEGTSYHLDSLSSQFGGVIQDFEAFAAKIFQSFNQWSEQAESRVIDSVLAIQGPRINAIANKIHEIKAG
jgi:DNA anti-recombination protein RmuC